jgi:photosystem II stability/assembly factor-like uncharacterized protein
MRNGIRHANLARLLTFLASALLCMGVLAPLGARPPLGGEAASADVDPYETNNDMEHAYGPLQPGSYEALIDPQGDRDFYSIDVPARCRDLRITLTGIPESCDYDLWLYDAAGEIITGSSYGDNQDELIDRANPAQGRYYIEVAARRDETYSASDTYLLGISRSDLVTDRVWEKVGPSGMSPPLADYSVAQVEACGQNVAYAVLDPEAPANGKVLKTTDYGESWQVLSLVHPTPGQLFDWTRQISVVNENVVWVGSVHSPAYSVARTGDGGLSWSYSGAPAYMYALEAVSASEAWDGGYYMPHGFIYHTTDGGFSWGEPEFGQDWSAINDIHQHGGDAWAVGTYNYSGRVVHRVYDQGQGKWGWAVVALPSGMPQQLEGCWTLEAEGKCVVWAVGGDTILKSLDGGASWSVYKTPTGAGYLRAVCALNPSTAYVAGDGGTILRTTDGGESWHFMYNVSKENLTSIYAVDADHAWASGDNGTLLRLVRANTRAGTDVTVDLGDGDTITFASVIDPGNTIKTTAPNPTGEEFEHHWCFRGCSDISTTAAYAGTIEVRMSYSLNPGLVEEGVRMLKKTGEGSWEDITASIDTENNVAIGSTDSLSEFVLIYPFPEIKSVTPNWGIRGSALDVDIAGYGFWETSTAKPYLALRRDGQEDIVASDVEVHDLYHVSCRFAPPPDAVLEYWDVYVLNPDDFEDTFNGGFRVMDPMPAPTITSTKPTFAQRGSEDVKVDILGSGFWGAFPTVPTAWLSKTGEPNIVGDFYGALYDPTQVSYVFDLPADACPGSWDVHLRNPDGKEATLPGGFTITSPTPPPTVTSITPSTGAQGSDVEVTDLAGSGFYGTPTVKLRKTGQSDIIATGVTVESSTRITCTLPIPAGAATGAWDVVVKNPDNQQAALAGGFTVTAGGGGNTPPGSNVTVDLGGGKGAEFENVTGSGNTTVTPRSDPSVANFQVL